MRLSRFIIFLFLFLGSSFFENLLFAQSASQRSVQVSATVQTSPARIDFQWPADPNAPGYTVYKKELDANNWGTIIAQLPGNATSFQDNEIEVGKAYDYAFFKKGFDLYERTVCVPSNTELRFKIADMYNIGLCCNFGFGYYKVESCGELKANGADFGTQEITLFEVCDEGTECTDLKIILAPDMFPNSTSWTLKNNVTGEVLASSGEVGDFIIDRPEYGFIYAGIEVPAIENRGSILILVDKTYESSLAAGIDELRLDLIKDGWKPTIEYIDRSENVSIVRFKIQSQYNQLEDLKALYLLGHIPVPYSGDIYPDTHSENHQGAWAADSYYGELNGVWTDQTVNITTAFFDRNKNIPGDGKFDQDSIPTDLELQVGRVDLFNMPAFAANDTELTRAYLMKSHNFKHGLIEVERRGLIDDNFQQQFAGPAASGWRNFSTMFGAENIDELDYFSTMSNESYLWSYGCGSGSHISSEGIGTTTDFANNALKTVFTMLFGSQFGDWDNENNFLKAPLASGMTLTNVWAGNPPWNFQHMSMGHNIGYSTIKTLNSDNGVYLPGPQLVHANLMGDPSLRMHPVKTPSNIGFVVNDQDVEITWSAPNGEQIDGYHIYRSNNLYGHFERVGVSTTNAFTDVAPPDGNNVYMVRTLKLETTGSGTYYNLSLGTIDSTQFSFVSNLVDLEKQSFYLSPNPAKGAFLINLKANTFGNNLRINIYDKSGKIVKSIVDLNPNHTQVPVDMSAFASGVYFVKIEGNKYASTEKLILLN